jgi:hypothetical protein
MAEIYKINDVEYECEFKLTNSNGDEINFTKSAIRGMTLIDNVFDPFMSGTITIANPYDFIENDLFIKGDGKDEFLIKFKPKTSKGFENEGFENTFAILDDSETVNPMVRSENFKSFNLISKDAINFCEYVPYNKIYKGKVGKLLKDVFMEVGVSTGVWSDGDFEITYRPPATFRYIDLMRYFLNLFYAKDGAIHVKGFINFNPSMKVYDFQLISNIFKSNTMYGLEAFPVGDITSTAGFSNPNNPISGPPVGEYTSQTRNLAYSTPLFTWTTDFFVNSLIFGYDTKLGQQKIKKIIFKDIRDKWRESFVTPFVSVGGSPQASYVSTPGVDKKFKRFKFPYPVEDGAKIVEAEMINALTFYNLQLTFTNIGNTIRSSNRFIDIVSVRKDSKILKSQEKLLGRWFITELHHVFFADLYTNTVYATKTYIGPQSKAMLI